MYEVLSESSGIRNLQISTPQSAKDSFCAAVAGQERAREREGAEEELAKDK